MKLFSQFSARAPNRVFVSILLGGLSGICYSLLIPLVLSVIKDGDRRFDEVAAAPTHLFGLEIANAPFAAVFALVCVFILVARTLSQIMLTRVAIDVASDLRTRMYARIANAPLPALERIGAARMIAALTTDVPRIVLGARMMPDLLINIVTLIGMLGFLLVLNSDVFVFVLGCIAFGVASYQIPMLFGRRHFIRARHGFDGLQESIQGLIHGIKELKLNDSKRQAFFDDVLMAHEHQVRSSEKAGHTLVRAASNYGDLLSFFVIGSILFIFVNYHLVSTPELIGVIMALLYITGPVAMILNYIPQLTVSRVSVQRVAKLFEEIPAESIDTVQEPAAQWDCVRFEQVSYHHQAAEGAGFQVGPLDLQIRKGQITFIVGGNGSGKSTLSKLITLHYRPTGGNIHFGEQTLSDATIGSLRQSIGAIYSDYYLFDRVLGSEERERLTELVEHYLKALQLDHKVKYRDGKFSTLSLSDGQRRRMALLAAILDDKDLYLFDEWAADQDPTFKAVFYYEILPALKRRNKAIVAISHDDRYFDVADQVVTLEDGKLASVTVRESEYVNESGATGGPKFVMRGGMDRDAASAQISPDHGEVIPRDAGVLVRKELV
ncbi:cyclic peptide export ABC transporter [Lysobacter gummosus]|uniref:cyclic peptide export ABC transporter n=1 Tax=Lysobacter gummosus TaxID=262324 RepID=UPI0036334758